MIAAFGIPVTKVERSKLHDIPFENIPFGKYFTDHMLEADYEDGEWKNIEIKPYQPLLLSPSVAALHYGQAIFEGIKAYKDKEGNPYIFRPNENYKRFNISAQRMQMPTIPKELFIEGMRQLIQLDRNWIPDKEDHSLYIRPVMFASDEAIGVRPSESYKFLILLSPTGPYYNAPMRIYVEEQYVRAVAGGVGYAKTAGNYAASLYPAKVARQKGYDQVLWTDAYEHKYLQEIGTMNLVLIIGDKAITPDLKSGAILAGVTRNSVLTLLKESGLAIEERAISIDEVIDAYKSGSLREVFGTGTAATISPIKELRYKDFVMTFETDKWEKAPMIKEWLDDIHEGRRADKYNWMLKV